MSISSGHYELCNESKGGFKPGPISDIVSAGPSTDVWRIPQPDPRDDFSAPIAYRSCRMSSFKSARVSVTVESQYWKNLYDQAGIILVRGGENIANSNTSPRQWVKAGVERVNDANQISVVAADRFADWSLQPIPGTNHGSSTVVTLEFERAVKHGEPASGLWVYIVDDKGGRTPIREVTWAFAPQSDGQDDGSAAASEEQIWIGIYVARPSPAEKLVTEKLLNVSFNHFELNLK
ncbi:MAG: hypothetical protein M4579_005773 [Chaenotheca gracillima]|nr:MAG: hypothetical protein M4579_005773 [Chaenotheca gracillima]